MHFIKKWFFCNDYAILKLQGGDSMEIIIHGDKIKVTKAMREYIEDRRKQKKTSMQQLIRQLIS